VLGNKVTNPNGQEIYLDQHGRWHDVNTKQFAVGPDGPAVKPVKPAAAPLAGPERALSLANPLRPINIPAGIPQAIPVDTLDTGKLVFTTPPVIRGDTLDIALGNNLGHNFPGVDILDEATQTVTSIKSIDTGASSYQTETGLEGVLRRDINKLAGFIGGDLGKMKVGPADYTTKVLQAAIPETPLTGGQAAALGAAADHAAKKGIQLRITIVR
jgi:hypothetical protein